MRSVLVSGQWLPTPLLKSKVYLIGDWIDGFHSPFPDQTFQQFGHQGSQKEESHPQYNLCGREALKMDVDEKRKAMR